MKSFSLVPVMPLNFRHSHRFCFLFPFGREDERVNVGKQFAPLLLSYGTGSCYLRSILVQLVSP